MPIVNVTMVIRSAIKYVNSRYRPQGLTLSRDYLLMVNTWSFTLLLCFFQCSIFAEPVRYVIQEWSKESSGKLVLTCSDRCRDNFTCSVLWYLNQRIISDAINLTIDSGSEYGEYICTRSSDNAVLKKVLLIPPG